MSLLLSLVLLAAPCSTSTDGGTVITCGGAKVLVSLAVGAPFETLPKVVDGMASLYSATERRNAEVVLGKQKHPAIELTLMSSATDKKPMGIARVTAVKERDGVSRVLVCIREPTVPVEQCQPAFEAGLTVKNPTAPEPSLAETPRAWTGAQLKVPADCKQAEPGSIQCKSASLMWGDRPSEGPLNSQKVLAELALRQMPPGSTSAERKCRIGGKPSTCAVLRGTANRSVFTILLGVGLVGDRSTSFQCIALSELKDTVPAPCDQLVAFDRD